MANLKNYTETMVAKSSSAQLQLIATTLLS